MSFRVPIKVCFADIDNAGIVYYPRFLHYFHIALEDFFKKALGIELAEFLHKKNISFPTVHLEADFRRKLKYGDIINIEVQVLKIGDTSIKWGYKGYLSGSDEEIVVEGSNTTVCARLDNSEKISVPQWLRESLCAYQTDNRESQ